MSMTQPKDGPAAHSGSHNGRPQVMVVDDDLSMCNFLRSFLSQRGYQAVTLGSAEEAVNRDHAEQPPAVVPDPVMPRHLDGLGPLPAVQHSSVAECRSR